MVEYILTLFIGLFVGCIMSIPPGPVGIIVFQRSMIKSRLLGLTTGAGASTADTLFATIGLFGISIVWVFIDTYGSLLRVIGGSIILIIGLISIFSDSKPELHRKKDTAITFFEHFISGFGLTITNPLTALTFFFIFSRMEKAIGLHHIGGSVGLIFGVFFGSLLWWSTLSHIAHRLGHKIKPEHLGLINKFFGLSIALIGGAMILGAFL